MPSQGVVLTKQLEASENFLHAHSRNSFLRFSLVAVYGLTFFLFLLWQLQAFEYYSYSVNLWGFLLFLIGGTSALFFGLEKSKPAWFLVVQATVLASFAYLILSQNSLFLIVGVIFVLGAGLLEGFALSLFAAFMITACMNLAFVFSASYVGAMNWTSVVIFNGTLLLTGLVSGFLTEELRRLADQFASTQKDLSQLKNLSDLMIDKMTTAVLVVDGKGRIVRNNPEANAIFETNSFEELYLEDLSAELWQKIKENGIAFQGRPFEVEHTSNEGYRVLLEAYAVKLSPEIDSWMVFLQNRTKIRNLEEKLRQNEKLAAIGQLAAGIAHEIRNPLASISGSVQLLAGSLQTETAEDKKLFAIVIKEIDRLNDLISEFMEYVRPEHSERAPVDLVQLLQDCIAFLQRNSAYQSVHIEREFPSFAMVSGSATKLKQALLNILINAAQAMEKTPQKRITVKIRDVDSAIELSIADTGGGIPREQIRKIFQPFHTTKAKGTGLGLAITHKILEAHNADVDVDSTLGQGTRFLIRFPLNKV